MFKRRIKKKGLPEWIGTSSEVDVEVIAKDPVCSTNLQNEEDLKKVSATLSCTDTKPESGLVKHSSEKIVVELPRLTKIDDNSSEKNKKNIKMGNRKRKHGIGFLDNRNMSSERELNSRKFDEQIAQSLPLLTFSGSIIYVYNADDCSLLCEDLMEQLNSREGLNHVVGFDMEWPVLYEKGQGSGKVSLIQVSFSEERCYLFHIAAMGTFPKSLKLFLHDNRLMKVGINIDCDFWKLERDFDDIKAKPMIMNSKIDLSTFANEKLKSSENWSLEGLCRHVLKMRLDKTEDVRCGNWQHYPLSEQQKQYAATDSYTCLKIFNSLSSAAL